MEATRRPGSDGGLVTKPATSTIKLVVFDCDGVLFESEAANIAFYDEVLRKADAPPMPASAEMACHALSSRQLFEVYYGDRPQLLARIHEAAAATDYAPFYGLMKPRPRLRDFLSELRRDFATALATNRSRTIHGVLAAFDLGDLFDFAVGVLDVERPKPHPEMLHKCLQHFGLAAREAVYVGDQPGDAAAAAAAGMPFVGIGPVAAQSELSIANLQDLAPRLRDL